MADPELSCFASMCSWCGLTTPPNKVGFMKCGGCLERSYSGKSCQVSDWNIKRGAGGDHRRFCKSTAAAYASAVVPTTPRNGQVHRPGCMYRHRNPLFGDEPLVKFGKGTRTHPTQLVCTGMNICMLVVVKTANAGLIGWHASVQYDTGGVFSHKLARIKKVFNSIKMEDFKRLYRSW